MSLRTRLGMFVLTPQEQRTIAFIVLMVLLGLATKHYRHTHARQEILDEPLAATASPSPTVRAR